MNNVVIDRYTLEIEVLSENENAPTPVRCIATNTDDKTTAEAWLTREKTQALFSFAYGNERTIVDWCMQQLEDNHYVDLITPQPEGAKASRCVFNAAELLLFGFVREELRPWRVEK